MLKSVPKYSYFNSQWKIPYIPEREQFLKKSTYDTMTAFLQFIFIKSIFSKKITTQQNKQPNKKRQQISLTLILWTVLFTQKHCHAKVILDIFGWAENKNNWKLFQESGQFNKRHSCSFHFKKLKENPKWIKVKSLLLWTTNTGILQWT